MLGYIILALLGIAILIPCLLSSLWVLALVWDVMRTKMKKRYGNKEM